MLQTIFNNSCVEIIATYCNLNFIYFCLVRTHFYFYNWNNKHDTIIFIILDPSNKINTYVTKGLSEFNKTFLYRHIMLL